MDISRSVLVPHSAERMFDLIERAELYPEFVPWCTSATILERNDEWVSAHIGFTYRGFSFGFQTRNAKCRPEWLSVRLVEGPFRHFHGDWRLVPIGDLGCRVLFDVSYEISHGVLDKLALPAVEFVSRSMIDAFVRRAEQTLGDADPPPAIPTAAAAPPAGGEAAIAPPSETT